jgi:CheY-like chemotaxis protein
MKILLVEDHPAVAMMSCIHLRDLYEHEVQHANTGEKALAMLAEFQPELVLIDVGLPDMDGYTLASRIRAHRAGHDVVLVALTGWGNLIETDRASAVGFDAHFRKPMDFEQLPRISRQDKA